MSVNRVSLASLLALVAVLVFGTSSATAGAPTANWRVLSTAFPTDLPPGEVAWIELNVENIGDAATSGEPVTLVDHLPVGVKALRAGAMPEKGLGIESPGSWG